MPRTFLLIAILLLVVLPSGAQQTIAEIDPALLDARDAVEAAGVRTPAPRLAGRFNFTVNSSGDTVDVNVGNGVCADSGGQCTLRAAVMEANASAGPHTISVAYPFIELFAGSAGDNVDSSGDLDIASNITITGTAAQPTALVNPIDRVFDVQDGGNLSLTNIKVTLSGNSTQSGGGIRVGNGASFTGTRIVVVNNIADAGAGIYINRAESFRLFSSAIIHNHARDGNGGGLFFRDAEDAQVVNSTIAGNSSTFTFSGSPLPGGGVYVVAATGSYESDVAFIHSTIAHNTAGVGGGLFVSKQNGQVPPLMSLHNTIVGGNLATVDSPNCYVTLGSSAATLVEFTGRNLFGTSDPACGLPTIPQIVVEAPMLGALNDGAPPNTKPPMVRLTNGSPAINLATSCDPAAGGLDQHGGARPRGPACDVGAHEAPTGISGTIDLFPDGGGPGSSFSITVQDADLSGNGTLAVDVVTTNTVTPDRETIILNESPANSGTFVKQVTLAPLPVAVGNGLIEAAGGHTVTITYHDWVDATAADKLVSAPYIVLKPAIQLLQNGSFEFGLDGWTLESNVSGDKVRTTPGEASDGIGVFRFKGQPGKKSTLSQNLISAPRDFGEEAIEVSFDIRGGDLNSNVHLQLVVQYASGGKAKLKFPLSPSDVYTTRSMTFVPYVEPDPITKFEVLFVDKSLSGKVYIDRVRVASVSLGTRGTDPETRTETLPPPAAPSGFRGSN
ncbi:MAG: right-handed parallel beta-helix repeat-containing protein [Chloroflexi bacterium]|nr:right-handed parallel beta-helix repeat-containing protein [Chloroflexota bacterium]